MPKLRKMLGDVNSQECAALMHLIETQSQKTLAAWAVSHAKDNYLAVYEKECPEDSRLRAVITVCEEYLDGSRTLTETKPALKEAQQIARETADQPVAQAAARAISTACSAIQTPTNALGFLFYGAAAAAYSRVGLEQTAAVYNDIAAVEFQKAYDSLKQVSVGNEQNPVKLKWNC